MEEFKKAMRSLAMPRFEVIQTAIKSNISGRIQTLREKFEQIQDEEIAKARFDEDHRPSVMNDLERMQMELERA